TDQSAFIDQQTSQLDGVLTMIQILLGLAILIAVLGIINTLVLSMLERTRELGLLRTVGLSQTATIRMVTVEAVVISLFGALLGVTVGVGLGAAVVRALADEGIDRLALPWSDMAGYVVLAGLVGVIAALLPAVRAARPNVLGAIAREWTAQARLGAGSGGVPGRGPHPHPPPASAPATRPPVRPSTPCPPATRRMGQTAGVWGGDDWPGFCSTWTVRCWTARSSGTPRWRRSRNGSAASSPPPPGGR